MSEEKLNDFKELQTLVRKIEDLSEYEKRASSISIWGRGSSEGVSIYKNDNGRYTFSGIANYIGDDKLTQLVEQFKDLVSSSYTRQRKGLKNRLMHST